MKRRKVIQKLKREALERGLEFEVTELTNHTAYRVGKTSRTLGRHNEIPELTVIKFYQQFANELGKGWWK